VPITLNQCLACILAKITIRKSQGFELKVALFVIASSLNSYMNL
jgi:hypothetical protein